jgi:hypothetical protein
MLKRKTQVVGELQAYRECQGCSVVDILLYTFSAETVEVLQRSNKIRVQRYTSRVLELPAVGLQLNVTYTFNLNVQM